uniref:Uncharacterized protein n=1 Tax=Triticum urartu TaxID=4572 RepID=A0A8R7U6D4_TRIUA
MPLLRLCLLPPPPTGRRASGPRAARLPFPSPPGTTVPPWSWPFSEACDWWRCSGFGIVLLQMIANTQNDEIIAPVLDELLLLENTTANKGGLCNSAVI